MAKTQKTAASTKTPKAQGATAAPAKKGKQAAKPEPKKVAASEPQGLKGVQVRVLAALAKAKTGLTRKAAAEAAGMPYSGLTFELGAVDDTVRTANDASHYPSLLSLGAVKLEVAPEGERGFRYVLTPKGRKMMESAQK
jgi:hypothetical protein